MALGAITVSAVRFDNEPFVRSLTATILPGTGSAPFGTETVAWLYSDEVWAVTKTGQSYVSETTGTYSQLSTVYFYVSTDTYDFRVASYDLFEQVISAVYLDPVPNIFSSDSIQIIYDNFPNIQVPTLYFNNENTNFLIDRFFFLNKKSKKLRLFKNL